MTPAEFHAIRIKIGTQRWVSDALGINNRTLQRVEKGHSNFVDELGDIPLKYSDALLNLHREMQ